MQIELLVIGTAGAVISVLLSAVAFFLNRTFKQLDKLGDAHGSFAISLNRIATELNHFRAGAVSVQEFEVLKSKVLSLENRGGN